MEFVTLQTVLDGIVASIPPEPYVSEPVSDKFKDDESLLAAREFWEQAAPKIDDARQYSEAAQKLNAAMRHSSNVPRWRRYDKEEKTHVAADELAGEARNLLKHAIGWEERERENCFNHVEGCVRCGLSPASVPIGRSTGIGLTLAGSFFRPMEIGFDRAEIIPFLDANGIAHDLGERDKTAPKQQRQDRRLKACEDAGLVMPASSIGRLPDGVGRIADLEGVKRQSFTADVKAALRRREAITKPGRVVRHA